MALDTTTTMEAPGVGRVKGQARQDISRKIRGRGCEKSWPRILRRDNVLEVYEFKTDERIYLVAAPDSIEATIYFQNRFAYEGSDIKSFGVRNVSDQRVKLVVMGNDHILPLKTLVKIMEITETVELTELNADDYEDKIRSAVYPTRLYVSGPYTADTWEGKLENTNKAIDAGRAALKKGYAPVIPHLSHFFDLRAVEAGEEVTYNEYMEWDIMLLFGCNYFLYLGDSKGAEIELQIAKSMGIPIYYSIDELPEIKSSFLAHECLEIALDWYANKEAA